MAHTHDTGHGHGTTVVEERDSSAGIIVGVLIAVLVLFLLWVFFFSGWVGGGTDVESDRDGTVTNIEEEGDTQINVPQDQEQTTTDQQQPADTTSP